MDLEVKWSPEAIEDLESIAEYVARDFEYYARSVVTEILAVSRNIREFPSIGRIVPELRESGIDVSCVKITPYKIDEQIVIVPKVVIPLEEAKQYLIDIKRKEEVKEQSGRKYRPKTMKILIENHLVQGGDQKFLKNGLPSHLQFEEGNPVFQAEITGKLGKSNAVMGKR